MANNEYNPMVTNQQVIYIHHDTYYCNLERIECLKNVFSIRRLTGILQLLVATSYYNTQYGAGENETAVRYG